ncbi:aminopeptidase N [Biomphalaria glabrata]|nr:aminopeptidase N [Biomphalaria glabrata]
MLTRIDTNFRSFVSCCAVSRADWDEWNLTLTKYLETELSTRRLTQALSCARQRWILNQYGSSFFSWQRLLASYTSYFNTGMELDELIDFQVQHKGNLSEIATTLSQAFDNIMANIKWMENYQPQNSSDNYRKTSPIRKLSMILFHIVFLY